MKKIEVCAAVIRKQGKILLCSRPPNCSMAGYWEFPGGKINRGESDGCCLKRELLEELSLEVIPLDQIFCINHQYPDKQVDIHFYRCLIDPTASPQPREGQDFSWLAPDQLSSVKLLPADLPLAIFLKKS